MNSLGKLACGIGVAVSVLGSAASALAWSGHGGDVHRGVVVRGHGFVGPRHFFGPRVFVGPVFVGPAFVPLYYPPAIVYSSPVVVEQPAPVYAPPDPQYWYYCPDSRTYYPYTQQCPSGWLQVVPSPAGPR